MRSSTMPTRSGCNLLSSWLEISHFPSNCDGAAGSYWKSSVKTGCAVPCATAVGGERAAARSSSNAAGRLASRPGLDPHEAALRGVAGRGAKVCPPPSVSCRIGEDRKAGHGEIRGQPIRSWLGQQPGSTLQTPFDTDRVHSVGIREGLSRVSWKLPCTVLRGGTIRNGGSLLDKKTTTGKHPKHGV